MDKVITHKYEIQAEDFNGNRETHVSYITTEVIPNDNSSILPCYIVSSHPKILTLGSIQIDEGKVKFLTVFETAEDAQAYIEDNEENYDPKRDKLLVHRATLVIDDASVVYV